MRKVLGKKFFEQPTGTVARRLLGKFLVRRAGNREIAAMITETEAYDGLRDKASHASRGKTKRNAPMFGPAGRWYIYFTYGMHWMLNIVTGKKDYPAAVLIRGVQGVSGPARVTKRLKIDKRLNGMSATKKSGLWIAASPPGRRASPQNVGAGRFKIKSGPRVGVHYAGPYWARRRWRFWITRGAT